MQPTSSCIHSTCQVIAHVKCQAKTHIKTCCNIKVKGTTENLPTPYNKLILVATDTCIWKCCYVNGQSAAISPIYSARNGSIFEIEQQISLGQRKTHARPHILFWDTQNNILQTMYRSSNTHILSDLDFVLSRSVKVKSDGST